MKRFIFLLSLLVLLYSCGGPQPRSEGGILLAEAAEWLWSQQSEDGGWHSETHGLLKQGQVLTPFILDALLAVPDSIYAADKDAARSALDFIRSQVNAGGVLGLSDPDFLEYPNYATAFGLKVLWQRGDAADREFARPMRDYLLAQQFDEDRGIGPEHAAYGGWGFGETVLSPGNVGHVDLSHTRRVLEALAICEALDGESSRKARIFLARCQQDSAYGIPEVAIDEPGFMRYNGGFVYSPLQQDLNKGGLDLRDSLQQVVRAYGTATSDGWLALRVLGAEGRPSEDALAWLLAHESWEGDQGIPEDSPNQWRKVMVYYHLCVRAQVYGRAFPQGEWREGMIAFLRERKQPQGYFYNSDGAANKENDPLLATAMVVRALTAAL